MSADAGEEAEFGEDKHGDVHGLVVADEAGVAAAVVLCITLDREDAVLLSEVASGVFDGDGVEFGIVVDVDVFCGDGAPDAEIAERSFLAGESFFLGDGIPLVALLENRFPQRFPDVERAGHGGLVIEFVFVFLAFFGKFCGEEFLRCLLGAFVSHWARLPRKNFTLGYVVNH